MRGYKFLILALPTMLSLIMLTLWLYPRWPKTRASLKEKITAVLSQAIREAIQKEMKAQTSPEGPKKNAEELAQEKHDEKVLQSSDDTVNIIAKGTADGGLVFYTDKDAGCAIDLNTSPSGAEIVLNGTIVGATPLKLRGDCNSSFKVKLLKKNYQSVDRTIAYKDAKELSIRLHPEVAPVAPPKSDGGIAAPFQRGVSDMMDGEF